MHRLVLLLGLLMLSLNLNAQIPARKWFIGPGVTAVALPCCDPLAFFNPKVTPIGYTILFFQTPVDNSIDGYYITVTLRDAKEPTSTMIVKSELVLFSNSARGPVPYPRSAYANFVAGRDVILVSVSGQPSSAAARHVLQESDSPPPLIE